MTAGGLVERDEDANLTDCRLTVVPAVLGMGRAAHGGRVLELGPGYGPARFGRQGPVRGPQRSLPCPQITPTMAQ
jgi:hypothetical protein